MASENGTYPGLLVDWGGVLTSDVFASFGAFCELEGIERDALARIFRTDPECGELIVGLETGAVAQEDFEPRVAALLGVAAPGLIDRLFAGARPDEDMIEAVRRARVGGIRTGLVSNSWGTRRYPRDLLAELFDAVVISGEVGLRKPHREMYALGAERIGLAPADCVFVDDLGVNLASAAKLGMTTVHHRAADETIPELERLLGVSLR
ncbi:MAG TPA: HAD family phosphatase [Solirubrobacteraceae bacterium]|jgi:epoxide hydrolase-like predicted phosphatase|nr:HAD family phosphatase [Solirubrobacteraceae bacterium]